MAYYEKRAPIGFSCALSRLICRTEVFFVARGGMLRARHTGEMLALRASGNSFNFHDFESLVLYAAVYPGVYRAFSLTRPASIQIYMNKRNCLRKERVQFPRDQFGTPTWPPFCPVYIVWNTKMGAVTSCENALLSRRATLHSFGKRVA